MKVRDGLRWVVWGSKVLLRGARHLWSILRSDDLKAQIEPWRRYTSVEDIPFDELAGHGVKGVLFDLENTLIPSGGPFTDDGRALVARVRDAGLGIGVVSNASAGWVKTELDREAIPFIAPAGKPGARAFHDGCRLLGTGAEDTVYVGDQLLTDVVGSQRAGLRAILVEPRYDTENRSARFQRVVVRFVKWRASRT